MLESGIPSQCQVQCRFQTSHCGWRLHDSKTNKIELNFTVIKQNKTNQPTKNCIPKWRFLKQCFCTFVKEWAEPPLQLIGLSVWARGTESGVSHLLSTSLIPRAEFRSWKSLRPGQPRPLHHMPSSATFSHYHSPFTLSSFLCHSLISVLLCRDNC